jgi:hypothetical protein
MKPLCCSDFSRDSLSNLTGKILRVTGNSFRVTGKFHLQTCFGRRPSPGTKSRPTNRQLVHFIAAPPMQPFQQVCSHPRLGITNLAEAPAGGGSRPRQRTSEAHIGLLSRLSRRKSLCAFSLNKLSVRVATPMVLGNETGELSMIEGISAITLGTHEMPRAVRFYRAPGFEVLHGGEDSSFTSFRAGASYLNLIVQSADRRWSWWGRLEGLFRSQLFSFQCACATGHLSSSRKSIFALLLPRV